MWIGCEYHFLSMHLINNMYVVDEHDAFVLPNSYVCFSEIGNVVKVIKKFKVYHLILIYEKSVYGSQYITI
jgi:hypothetical protein